MVNYNILLKPYCYRIKLEASCCMKNKLGIISNFYFFLAFKCPMKFYTDFGWVSPMRGQAVYYEPWVREILTSHFPCSLFLSHEYWLETALVRAKKFSKTLVRGSGVSLCFWPFPRLVGGTFICIFIWVPLITLI